MESNYLNIRVRRCSPFWKNWTRDKSENDEEELVAFDNFIESVNDVWEDELDESSKSKLVSEPENEYGVQDGVDFLPKKESKLCFALNSQVTDLKLLQTLSWSGIPDELRPDAWKILTGYLPLLKENRDLVMSDKRDEYWTLVEKYFFAKDDNDEYRDLYRQIFLDVPRMSPNMDIFRQQLVQESFERILFVWSAMNPKSNYVQGINDLLTPFYIVFLKEYFPSNSINDIDVASLQLTHRLQIEADSFWCFTKFVSYIEENYETPPTVITNKILRLSKLIQRVDAELDSHIVSLGVEYVQFSFRWMNNLLTRELPIQCLIRLWDTYLAEIESFSMFQLYVCAAFLLRWKHLLFAQSDFQMLMTTLQNLPTNNWKEQDVDLLVAEAYRLKYTFDDAPSHLQN